MDINDQILAEVKELKSWLYGADGHIGDIPTIKACFEDHDKRLRRVEIIIAAVLGSGAVGGVGFGVAKLIGG